MRFGVVVTLVWLWVGAGSATAATPVTVDRDFIMEEVQSLRLQVASLQHQLAPETQVGGTPVGQNVYRQLELVQQQLDAIRRQVAVAPAVYGYGYATQWPAPPPPRAPPGPPPPRAPPGARPPGLPPPPTRPLDVPPPPSRPRMPPKPAQRTALDGRTFLQLVLVMKAEGYNEEKLVILSEAAESYTFSVTQVMQLSAFLNILEDRLQAVELLAPWLSDPKEAGRIEDLFDADESKARVRAAVQRAVSAKDEKAK